MRANSKVTFGICLAMAAALSSAGLVAGCQNTSATGGEGGGGGGKPSTGSGQKGPGFTPTGCGFSINPRPEYKSFTEATAVTLATPDIRRVRLGLGGNVAVGAAGRADPATSVGVAWQTDDGTFASDVAWGTDPDPSKWDSAQRASGVTWLTPQGDLNGMGDERMHEAYVCGLEAETTYYYRVGGGPAGKEVWSQVHSFTTTPKAGSSTVKIGITGDSRGEQNNAWQILQQRMLTVAPTLQLFSGDMINLAPDQGEWEQWLDSAAKDSNGNLLTLGQILTLAAHGNHDNHTALFFGNLTLPQDNKTFPTWGELFFSVDVGPVHIIVLDDTWIADPTGDMDYQPALATWLEADLTAAEKNRSKVPWIMAMHHRPELSSSNHGQDPDVLLVRQFLMPIWDKHHVDLVVTGHDHDYERSKPVTGPADSPVIQQSSTTGTTYVVCAGSGADGYGAGNSTFTAASHDYKSGGAIGLYGVITADATSLTLDAHELRADASDPKFDSIKLTK